MDPLTELVVLGTSLTHSTKWLVTVAIRLSVLGVILVIGGIRSPCSQVPAFSKHLEKGFHWVIYAARVAMDTSLLHIEFGTPLIF